MTRKIKKYTVTVIVLSYNRPKMLQETLASIKDADEVIVVDDGSTFDVVSVVKKFKFPKFSIVGAPRISIEERLVNQRLPMLINEALKQAIGDIITYICDDDAVGEEWPSTLKAFYEKHGEKYHVVRGECVRFEGGQQADYRKCIGHLLIFSDSPRQLITGNFAHLRKCFKKEKIKWPTGNVVGHDTALFEAMDKSGHDTWTVPLIPVIACHRRMHDKMLTNHTFYDKDGTVPLDKFSDSAKQLLVANQFLE